MLPERREFKGEARQHCLTLNGSRPTNHSGRAIRSMNAHNRGYTNAAIAAPMRAATSPCWKPVVASLVMREYA